MTSGQAARGRGGPRAEGEGAATEQDARRRALDDPTARHPAEGGYGATEDLAFQRRMWQVQRIGWVVMVGVTVAGLLGLFGTGPLSVTTSTSPDGAVSVEHQAIVRHTLGGRIDVVVAGSAVSGDRLVLVVDRAWLEGMTLRAIVPEPSSQTVLGDELRWTFDVERPGEPLEIGVDVVYEDMFLRTGSIGLAGGPSVDLAQFVFP